MSIFFLLSSCDDKAQGYLDIYKPLKLRGEKQGTFTLPPGKYITEIKIDITQEMVLTIYKNPKDYVVSIKKGQYKIPKEDDFSITLEAESIEQEYDLIIDVKTKSQFSDLRHKYYACGTDTRHVEQVDYKNKMVTRFVKIKFVEPNSKIIFAQFHGEVIIDKEVDIKKISCPQNK